MTENRGRRQIKTFLEATRYESLICLLPRFLQHLPNMLPGGVGDTGSAHHPNQFFNAGLSGKRVHAGDRAAVQDKFLNTIVTIGASRYL
jgi:hypothetical protein